MGSAAKAIMSPLPFGWRDIISLSNHENFFGVRPIFQWVSRIRENEKYFIFGLRPKKDTAKENKVLDSLQNQRRQGVFFFLFFPQKNKWGKLLFFLPRQIWP